MKQHHNHLENKYHGFLNITEELTRGKKKWKYFNIFFMLRRRVSLEEGRAFPLING